jgi:hypothetical protein
MTGDGCALLVEVFADDGTSTVQRQAAKRSLYCPKCHTKKVWRPAGSGTKQRRPRNVDKC